MHHINFVVMDPPGTENRRWKCADCGLHLYPLSKLLADTTCSGPTQTFAEDLVDALEGQGKFTPDYEKTDADKNTV